jgi:hypothetical protein
MYKLDFNTFMFYMNVGIIIIATGYDLGYVYGSYLVNELNTISFIILSIVFIIINSLFIFVDYIMFKGLPKFLNKKK